jgi:hypothetical protein
VDFRAGLEVSLYPHYDILWQSVFDVFFKGIIFFNHSAIYPKSYFQLEFYSNSVWFKE